MKAHTKIIILMKKVLVPFEIHFDIPLVPIHGARSTYIKKLTKYKLFPIFVSPLMTKEMIMEAYNLCDGVYFIAGEDISHSLYTNKKHPETVETEVERDLIEIPLLQIVLKDKKPFLGICRGGQGLAVASGGTLIQHLPDVYPDENHNPNKKYNELLDSPKHEIRIKKDSKIYRILQMDSIMVNSYHHQAIDNPGTNLEIVGTSPAGVTEIIEHTDPNYFCFGVQSHPEAEENSFMENLFYEFAKAISSV